MSRSIAAVLLVSFLPACVTTHVGTPVELTAMPVQVSCGYSPDIASRSLSGIVCVLENSSPNWQDLKLKELRFPDQKDVSIVSAEDMRTLAEAYAIKKTREDNNIGLALGALVLTGALVAVGAHDSSTATAGQAAVLAGATAASAKDIKQGYDSAQYGPAVYGREHLLGGSLRIPPDLTLRRQVVINHPKEKPRMIDLCWDVPQNTCSRVTLRD